MTGARLAEWEALDRRRRREAARGAPAWIWSLAATATVVGGLAWVGRAVGPAEALTWWRVLAMSGVAIIFMRGPWQVYWTPDATLLARLPIEGKALYRLALGRSLRLAGWVAEVLLFGGLALAWARGTGRHAPLDPDELVAWARGWSGTAAGAAGTVLFAALAAPAVTTAAGTLVASDRAHAAVSSMAGEFAGPRVIWLSLLPSAAAMGAVWGQMRLIGWIAQRPTAGAVGLAACAAAGLLVAAAGLPMAARWLPAAMRDVAALDRVQLAHVETSRAVGLEAAWGRLTGGGAVYRKDVALARRRYPAFYIVTGAGQIAAWITAAVAGRATRERVVVVIVAALAAYVVTMARRLTRPPIEYDRLLVTLPLQGAARAKMAYAAWRAAVPLALASVVAIARSPAPLLPGAAVVGIIGAAWIGSVLVIREGR